MCGRGRHTSPRQSLNHVRRASTVHTLGHIFVVLRRSPAEIASPSPSPCRRAAGTHPLPRRLAGSRRRGCHQAERVLNAEVPSIRYFIGLDRDWIVTSTTTSTACYTLPLNSLRRYVDTLSPLVAMLLLDRSWVFVGFFLFSCFVPHHCF